jgi:hypothetical protein
VDKFKPFQSKARGDSMRVVARVVLLVLSLVATRPALASGPLTLIDGAQYGTGYLPWPRTLGDRPIEAAPLFRADELPESYDSRDFGLVTPIKNQGNCGSCWAFARTRALEAAMLKAGKLTPDLAEQDTLVNDKTAYGCGGGFMDGKYETNHGVTKETLCPYKASDRGSCTGAVEQKAARWAILPGSPSVDQLRAAIYQYGTLFVTVAAGGDFSPGSDGRITRCGSRRINHMVTLQGYRKAADGGYEFLIGNSWGTGWGDDGYAWSKQGCNKLASESGDAAGYFYVEGTQPPPPPPPPPPPATNKELPIEVKIAKGSEAAVQVRAVPAGRRCKWSTGETGCRIWVKPQASESYSVTVKDIGKDAVTETVKVVPQ